MTGGWDAVVADDWSTGAPVRLRSKHVEHRGVVVSTQERNGQQTVTVAWSDGHTTTVRRDELERI